MMFCDHQFPKFEFSITFIIVSPSRALIDRQRWNGPRTTMGPIWGATWCPHTSSKLAHNYKD